METRYFQMDISKKGFEVSDETTKVKVLYEFFVVDNKEKRSMFSVIEEVVRSNNELNFLGLYWLVNRLLLTNCRDVKLMVETNLPFEEKDASASSNHVLERVVVLTKQNNIAFEVNYCSKTVDCEDPKCKEPTHTTAITKSEYNEAKIDVWFEQVKKQLEKSTKKDE